MKTAKCILSFTFTLFCTLTFSQGEFVVEINKTTGAFTKIGPKIADITWIYPDDRTYDENTGTFIFPSQLINHSLYSFNTSNASIINNPVIGNILNFQFDNSSNILYGIEQNSGMDIKNLVSINRVTGTYTAIGNSLPGSAMFNGFCTFNKINHTYIFLAPPNILYSINATNGTIISNPTLVLASGENMINFKFDNSTGILYGLLCDNNIGKYFLVTINPTTGTNVRIGSGSTFGAGNGSATIDELNQHYIYMYSNSNGYEVTTLGLATANVQYNALIAAPFPSDNFFSLEYDHIKGKLYSIHWDADSAGFSKLNTIHSFMRIYPNPFSTKSVLQIDIPLNNATLTMENCIGQTVKVIKNISKKTVTLSRDNLPGGIYFVRLTQDNKVIATKKILITD